eukprot:TRINITY_DN11708_c0_g1_i5.p1 TRINITY_DN11708_c0_g1~~TRINITY_DN11708_c0_g1_i5.p1  ORF type:complete len:436 (+),score=115.20 TRINITY_DN11708_c0_g1_i5:86-1309(+)
MSNDYLTLDIDCKDHRIKLLTQTLDPFSGVVYVQPIRSLRQGNEGPSFCKALGRGRHEISLEVGAGQCGWRRDGQKVQLDLYVQYDAHVQQVVDEKISVECDMATREGRMVTEVYTEEGMSVPVMSEMSYGVSQSMGKVKKENMGIKNGTKIERKSEPVKRGRMDDNQVRVVGWLDITEGSIQGGNPLSRPLEEGEYVMIAAKVKQVRGMDTMMTRCGMDDGQGDVRILTDERGCSLDSDVVGNIHTKYNEASKVKEMFANFKVPKFGVDTHLVIKCGVVVCDGPCPLSPCEDQVEPIKIRDRVVLETETDVIQAKKQKQAAAVASSVDNHSYNPLDKIQVDSELCLSPARIFLAFGTLLLILVLALLFSCVLWMKARRRIMPRPNHRQRGPLMMPNMPRPYIRVLP